MVDMNVKLHRIISLEGFLSLLYNKTERFVRPIDCWEDTFEGYMLLALDDEDGEKEVLNKLYNEIVKHRAMDAIRNYVKMLHARYLCYGQCWSIEDDSDAMWRIYSYGKKAIQLVTTVERVYNTITSGSNWDGKKPRIEEVKYDSKEIPIEETVAGYFTLGMPVDEPFFHKRTAFKHESEVRVMLNDFNRYTSILSAWCGMLEINYSFANKEMADSPFEEKVINAVSKLREDDGKVLHLKKAPKELFININNIEDYIAGIRVHPQAEPWYVNLIHKICDQHNMCFLGQSELYNSLR